MIRLYLRHRVHDYDLWRRSHDETGVEMRPHSGVVASGVHRSLDDPDEVTVWRDFETEAEARAFAERSLRPEASDETPQVWIARDAT